MMEGKDIEARNVTLAAEADSIQREIQATAQHLQRLQTTLVATQAAMQENQHWLDVLAGAEDEHHGETFGVKE